MKKLLRILVVAVAFFASGYQAIAQTTLISPTGAGGFELGTTFADNGWTVANSTNNPWIVAPLSNGLITGNAAIISDNGATPNYTSANNSSNYFWRDVTIPAGETKITLSFNWICNGESTWDMWQVFVAPTTVVPSGTTTYPGSGATAVPAGIAGASWVGNGNLQTTVQTATLFLPASAAGTTVRLIFHWKNDGGGAQPPAQIDNISLTSQVPGDFISITTGNWDNPLTWDANAVPTPGDNAIVSTGHTVTVNAIGQGITNLTVNGTLAYAAAPAQFNVNGNLSVNASGLVNVFQGTTGKTLIVSGNIINNGRIDVSVGTTTAGNLTLNGSSVQSVTGSGIWGGTVSATDATNRVGVIRNLTFSNTNTSTPNIIWSFNNIRIINNLNLTGARINLGTNKMIFGNYAAAGTLTSPVTAGFLPGATFARWWTTAATGTSISSGFDPTNATSRYPFLNTTGTSNRAMYISRTGSTVGNVAGELAVTYQDATTMTTGLSVLDGTYTVSDRYDGNWTVVSGPGYFHNGLHTAVLLAQGAYPPSNGNSRVMLANAAAGGTHQAGTTTPGAQRTGLSLAQLTEGPLYMGIASADNQYPCAGAPNNPEASATTAASVCPNGTVTMNATGLTTGFIGITNQWQVSSVSGGPYTNVVGGTGATTATHTTAPITTPGTYYYVLAHTCTNSGVTSLSNEVVVTVNTLPNVSATAANSGNFCGIGTLTATGAVNYTWSPATSLLSNTGASVTSIATSNTTFTVTGTDANGCVNTATAAIIYTAPPAITVTATNPSFCGTGGNSTLTASSSGNYSYVWEALDGATISTTSGNTTTASISQTSAFRVTGTEVATGCVEIQNYSIGVYPLPSATVTTTANGVCPGTSATIGSGLSAGNFSASCITAPTALSTPPANATTLILNGVAQTLPTGVSWSNSLDDGKFGPIPIGFGFNFFGSTQNTLNIGTNGVVNFGSYAAFNGTQYIFTGGFPNAGNPANTIAVCARDLRFGTPAGNGTLRYWVEGIAPNRRFIVQYVNVPVWSGVVTTPPPSGFNNAEAIFYETTGNIDIRVISATNGTNVPNLGSPTAQANLNINKYIGLQDGTQTIGATAPNCANSASNFWNGQSAEITSPQAWRFSPPSNYTTVWTANGTEIANGTNIFSQTVAPSVTTTYSISYTNQTTGCVNAPGSAQVTMQVLGTSAPNNVVAQASTVNACSGVTFNLSTNYTGLTDGLTYQWQSSPDGTTWTDITGATALTYSTSITASTSYRIGISSCGGTIEYSAPVIVGLSPPTDCYCTPVYTIGTTDGDLISNVTIVGTTLSNNTGFVAGGPSYTFYTGQPNYTATLLPSTSYTLQISTGEWGSQGYAAWIDYNDNGIFESSELIGATPTTIGSGVTTGQINASSSFTIALACTPPAGVHRMRIRGVFSQNGPTIDPCSSYAYGETEDYLITIAPAPTCPAPGLMTAGTTTSTSAPLSWNMGCSVATNFDFEYGPAGFVQGTGTALNNQLVTINGTTGSFDLTGLTPNSQYSVYYRANCGNGEVSPWSVATNFTTQCAPITLTTINPPVACDSYSLVPITEATPSNNAGILFNYYGNANGTGGIVTGPITSSQTIYAYASAGSCTAQQAVNITIYNTPVLTVVNPTICLGDSSVLWASQGSAIDFIYTLNGSFIGSGVAYHVSPTSTTTYGISAVGLGGCISAEQQATVTVNQPTTSTSSATSCDSYAWNGQTYTQSGTYTFTTLNAVGCDSVATLNLTINNSTTGSQTITACDSLVWNGQTYTQSGTYTYLTTNAVGCDSTVTLNLTINNSTTSSTNVTACVSYAWNGQTYTQSGVYTFTTQNSVGCDSLATLNLTINNALFTTENVSACVTYDWNGQTYTQSGTYTFLTTSVNGCDSTVTLNLTINQPSSSTTIETACDTYTWNGQTYTQSGTYVFNTATVAGCDSTATLVLTINNSTSSSSAQTACDSYTWNGQTYTQSGTYTFTTTNSLGCDSTATLLLTINNSTSSSSAQTACDSYTWNGQTYTQSGTYTFTTTNSVDCDSTATLILTINQSPTATATDNGDGTGTASAGASYQWIDCSTNTAIIGATQQTFAPSETGQYSVVVSNASGCSDTSACITIDVSKLNELNSLNVQVNPNPSNGMFNLSLNNSINGQIIITDATGRLIDSKLINGTSSVIDLSNAVTGIYYFTIHFEGSEKVVRVIKN